ncbi:MAG: hypothetical protein IJ218_01020 [Alphaproteobacteria bacterium]|nr:hypothetical protein [Alphaproteobacteria bacterium]
MDKAELKQILRAQIEPLDIAAKRKLAYLQSDDVFTDTPETYESITDSLTDTSLADAFASTISAHPEPAYQPQTQAYRNNANTHKVPQYATSNPSAETIASHKQNIAAKIAALRGISMPGDYLSKKH